MSKFILVVVFLHAGAVELLSATSNSSRSFRAPGVGLVESYRRVITPNSDGLNDEAYFLMDNPSDLQMSGKIYDLRGSAASDMKIQLTSSRQALIWDGRDFSGNTVSQGIYIYKIEAGETVLTGVIVVVR